MEVSLVNCCIEYKNGKKKVKKAASIFILECLMVLILVDLLLEIYENRLLLRVLLPKKD